MRVAIDASSAASGGGITYLREMLPRFAARSDMRLGPVLVRPGVLSRIGLANQADVSIVTADHRGAALGRAWARAVRQGADVVLVPTEVSLPRYAVPVVNMARNPCLMPGTLREYGRVTRGRFALQRMLARRTTRGASYTMAVSRFAGQIAESTLGAPASTVRVVYHGGPPPRADATPSPSGRLLFVSNLYRYKNAHRLLEALRLTPGKGLDIVGAPLEDAYHQELRRLSARLGLDQRVSFRGHLSGGALESAYRGASCMVWPSYAETFGHPLLEASSYGLPILAADVPVNREIVGERARYFDPFDVEAMARCLATTWDRQEPPGALPRQYSWDSCADQTVAVLAEAAGAREKAAPS
ncbi:MAG: glycosyltransferase [Acidimicrobiales bacterium]